MRRIVVFTGSAGLTQSARTHSAQPAGARVGTSGHTGTSAPWEPLAAAAPEVLTSRAAVAATAPRSLDLGGAMPAAGPAANGLALRRTGPDSAAYVGARPPREHCAA